MVYRLSEGEFDALITNLAQSSDVKAPVLVPDGGAYSDVAVVRYGLAERASEIVFDKKAAYSFRELLIPFSETLFFFTEDELSTPSLPKREQIIFLRSCDYHALKRLESIYLEGEFPDFYFKRLRSRSKFVVMGCSEPFENCFCAEMGTNCAEGQEASVWQSDGYYYFDNNNPEWERFLDSSQEAPDSFPPQPEARSLTGIPEEIPPSAADLQLWEEYDARCINCGRCTFVCPSCACFTMQDIFYSDNGRVGERRRVQASCMVDGYTDVAGGGQYRKTNGQRMRFKTLHKMRDHKARHGCHMCVGCGRCDDICPEYISFQETVRRLSAALAEEAKSDVRS